MSVVATGATGGRPDDRVVASPLLPGGDLIAAVLDRGLMGLADRGGASGLVGERWADLCAAHAAAWVGTERPVPGGGTLHVGHVARLDDVPAIAAAASRRALQNPDLLLVGTHGGRTVIQAADAKFSVETARAKQVSPAVVAGLLGLGDLVLDLIGETGPDPELVEGTFLCPDFPLTHVMLRRRHGIVRATVRDEQVALVPAPAGVFFAPVEGAAVMAPLAAVDALPVDLGENLLAALYYFRLARAAAGLWVEANGPLLVHDDRFAIDEAAVLEEAELRALDARSAFELVRSWDADVGPVRAARSAVDQVAAPPLMNRDLRDLINAMASAAGAPPPSVNGVRRRVGAWYRGQLRERVGPILPPVADLPAVLRDLGRVGAALNPALEAETRRVIAGLIAAGAEPAAAVTAGGAPAGAVTAER